MNSKFSKRIEAFLRSECSNVGLSYTWEWDGDNNCCHASIKREDATRHETSVKFIYDVKNDDLEIEFCDDSYYITREFDETVKYFWMLVAPALFPEN